MGGWLGGWGEIEIKSKLSPAEAEVWAELGKNCHLLNKFLVMRGPWEKTYKNRVWGRNLRKIISMLSKRKMTILEKAIYHQMAQI